MSDSTSPSLQVHPFVAARLIPAFPPRVSIGGLTVLTLLLSCTVFADDTHWSLRPIAKAAVPKAASPWPRTDIDHFVHARLRRQGLTPVADAQSDTLLRRAYFNLIGLPPTPDQIRAFDEAVGDGKDEALKDVVDELLASPHFGEKWARHWLDLARFAESNGKDRDVVFPDAWRYRDYVINAFNNDKPFDQFVREQVAGDLLENDTGSGQDKAGHDERIVATAFLALGPKAFQERNNEKFALDVVDEQIDVLTRSILGMTVACSRCHDHKYDPIATEDYYALAGILLSSDTRYGPGPLYFARHDKDTQLVPIGKDVEQLAPIVDKWRAEILRLTEKTTGLRSSAYGIQRQIAGALRERGLKDADDDPELSAKKKKMLAMRAEADAANAQRLKMIRNPPPERPAYTMAVLRSNKPPEDCAVRYGGVHTDRGDRIPRSTFSITGLPKLNTFAEHDSGRLQLADWLTSKSNPLTARVIVNRVWHHLFGTGLVRTVDNFGVTGEEPTHPELLDFLAAEFIEDGWSVKRLIRRIMLSRTWRLASRSEASKNSELDPENRFLWRANFRRLDVEAFRDSVLFVSGQLQADPRRGSLFQDVYAGMDYGEPNDHRANFDAEIAADRHRTVYLPLARNQLPEFLLLFDFPDPTATLGARNSRTIPAQALFLMNNPFVEQQSRAAALRVLRLPHSQRLEMAWLMATGRRPSTSARAAATEWLVDRTNEADAIEAWTDVMQTLFSSASFRYLE